MLRKIIEQIYLPVGLQTSLNKNQNIEMETDVTIVSYSKELHNHNATKCLHVFNQNNNTQTELYYFI